MLGMMRRGVSKFIINPKFQWSFIGRSLVLASINFALIYGAIQVSFWKFKEHGAKLGLDPESAFFILLDQQHQFMNLVFAGVGVTCFLLIVLGGIVISHRVAGPLYRLRHHMDDVSKGKTYDNVKFRHKDYFPELADSFNAQLTHIISTSKKTG